MSDEALRIKQLAEELTRLVEFVPATKDELEQWYDQAQKLQEGQLLRGAPHFLYHYLSDADIRMKDEVYSEMQNSMINSLLQRLRHGAMPTDEES